MGNKILLGYVGFLPLTKWPQVPGQVSPSGCRMLILLDLPHTGIRQAWLSTGSWYYREKMLPPSSKVRILLLHIFTSCCITLVDEDPSLQPFLWEGGFARFPIQLSSQELMREPWRPSFQTITCFSKWEWRISQEGKVTARGLLASKGQVELAWR